MTEKGKVDNLIHSKDDENLIKKSNLKEQVNNINNIKKPQTTRNNIKPKTLLGSKQNLNSSNNKTKKVKFNSKVEVIDVECWKIYNAEQTADENFDAFFTDLEKEDKEKINKEEKKNNNNNKRNTKKDTISCTCAII